MSINHVVLCGNLTRDPELRETASGVSILTFGIAVNDSRKNSSGEWEDYPHFIECVIFGARAEALDEILQKGMKVAVSGKLNYSAWENDEGEKRSKLNVVVSELDFMSARDDDAKPAKRKKRY